jgi:adenine-specific DNA-methyltransferase
MIQRITPEMVSELPKLVPSTRYQGSKRRILPWIYKNLKDLNFHTVLDGFGGTGSVSYMFKLMGKEVTFNDFLMSNLQTGIAFVENDSVKLDQSDVEFLLHENGFEYPDFIQNTFKDIYYYDFENKWLETVNFNIDMFSTQYSSKLLRKKRALAYHALFQACLSKRPFNLFHRKNLSLRKTNVKRSFGNKTTWDADFATLFVRFAQEASQKVFSNGMMNEAICENLFEVGKNGFDLVYLDPPYTRPNEKCPKDYYSLYHFLEGLVDYRSWPLKIDWSSKNRRLRKKQNEWVKGSLQECFSHLFEIFQDSIIVVSYGSPGKPSIEEIKALLLQHKSTVLIARKKYSYRLSRKNGKDMYEVLVIGK